MEHMKQIQYITRLNTGEIDKFVLVDVMWCGSAGSDLPDRGARVELTSLLLLVHFMFGFLAKLWPNIRPYLGLLKYLIVSLDRSPILLRVISWLHKVAKLTSSGYFPFHSKQPIDFLPLTANYISQVEEESMWQMTADNICLMLPPDPPQQFSDSLSCFSWPGGGRWGGGSSWESEDIIHQCKHQPPLSNWRISCWDQCRAGNQIKMP